MFSLNKLVFDMVSIDSVNPDLVKGARGEEELGQFVFNWCRDKKLEVYKQAVARGRYNIVAIARGNQSSSAKNIMLNAHLDTVGIASMEEPFGARIQQGRLYGRGAYDMKSGLGMCMQVCAEAQSLNLAGDVILAAVVDEEYASIGIQQLLKTYQADACIVAEPTDLAIGIAHKGFAWYRITTQGRAAHGSRADLGIDAIVHMAQVVQELDALSLGLRSKRHPLLGEASMHMSTIQGGQELSSYPDSCVLELERRTLPAEDPETILAEIQGVLDALARADSNFHAQVEMTLARDPFESSTEERIFQQLHRQASLELGEELEVKGLPFWIDAAFIAKAGIPTVVFGPAGEGAHASQEWCDLDSLAQCKHIVLETVKAFCA